MLACHAVAATNQGACWHNFDYVVAIWVQLANRRHVNTAISKFGKIDILVNNAGIIRRQDAIEYSEANWDDVLNVNLKTLFFLSQAVAKQFVKQGHGGKIINVASMLSFQGGIRVPSYTSSKSAVKGLTMALCNEWAKYGINVNAIAPGYMATNNTQALRQDEDRSKAILERIPSGRWGYSRRHYGRRRVFLIKPPTTSRFHRCG